jgi:folate-binding protein YgfZ
MNLLLLHPFHQRLNAHFIEVNGAEAVRDYGDVPAEYAALRRNAGVLDLSFRGRICVTGADRVRFLHGQVTNDVKRLRAGQGCYAALLSAKGKMESDLNLHCLADEVLLDFEPGLTAAVVRRLEKYVVADDVQLADVAPLYGLLSVQGPDAAEAVRALGLFHEIPARPFDSVQTADPQLGEIHLMNQPRLGSAGFDLFVPGAALDEVAGNLIGGASPARRRACGWESFELARIEAGIPRFGVDMDGTNLPLECGIGDRAVSYSKGCYLGQEIINRLHSFGRVAKELRGLRLADDLETLPARGERLFHENKDAGWVTSSVKSPATATNLALGYVRKEFSAPGTELLLRTATAESTARVVALPFRIPTDGPM